jgi:hypothetical protein
MSYCGYTWEQDIGEDKENEEHECILDKDHDGEHECECGESQVGL